ncbi:hypothetical protein CMV_026347 [Castanea mollissima]|uniref:Disease resistance protein n=1 Tax=Castanea mollissima TaxID=60419 RepID=A0A8J4V3Y5_9ROSI|nr:hypothetical protein CMV_026347 [Castanea mollissima]
MPSLGRLEITDCNKLETVPDGLKFVSALQELEIRWMPRAFKHRLEEGGEDFYKGDHLVKRTQRYINGSNYWIAR